MKATLIIIFFLTWTYFFVQSESKQEINEEEEFETTAVDVVDSLQMQDGLTPVDQDNPFVYAGRFASTDDTDYSSIGTPTNQN